MQPSFDELHSLPVADKLRLVERLWDDIAASDEPLPLDGEMQRVYWYPIERATARLTFETEQRVVDRARDHIDGSAQD